MFSKGEKKRLVLRWLFIGRYQKIFQLKWLQFKEESFFNNRQRKRGPSVSGQRVIKSSFEISPMKRFTIYYANSFTTRESGTLIT